MKKGYPIFLWACTGLIFLAACRMNGDTALPADSGQLVLVLTDSVNAVYGRLMRFERTHAGEAWSGTGDVMAVSIGRGGMAWGRGLHAPGLIPGKEEGDGRTPAGIFRLGPLFGLEKPDLPDGQELRMPFLPVTDALECVDDADSRYYNTLVSSDTAGTPDWTSSEDMASYTEAYRLGVVVQHNDRPVQPGAGSCIFLHVWSPDRGTTAGCTAMRYEDLKTLVSWLDAAERPVLVELPLPWYETVMQAWNLPEIPETLEEAL